MFSVVVNGSVRTLRLPRATEATVAALLAELALESKRIAVEKNGEIVPRSLHAATPIGPGDRIEIVAAVGGG